MFVTKVVQYDSIEKSMIHKVRNTVFTDEQGIPSKIDFDGLDSTAPRFAHVIYAPFYQISG